MAHSEGHFVRWQGRTITQLGYAVNLLLILTTGAFGFTMNLLTKDVGVWPRWSIFVAGALFLLAIVLGLVCVLNRLHDFRKTAQIAKDREDWQEQSVPQAEIDRRLSDRRCETEHLGKRTWLLLRVQAMVFVLGILTLSVGYVFDQRDVVRQKDDPVVAESPASESWLIQSWDASDRSAQILHHGNIYRAQCNTSLMILHDPDIPPDQNLRQKVRPCGELAQQYLGRHVPARSNLPDREGWVIQMWMDQDGVLELEKNVPYRPGVGPDTSKHENWFQETYAILSVTPAS